jgi:hypothetical protein
MVIDMDETRLRTIEQLQPVVSGLIGASRPQSQH